MSSPLLRRWAIMQRNNPLWLSKDAQKAIIDALGYNNGWSVITNCQSDLDSMYIAGQKTEAEALAAFYNRFPLYTRCRYGDYHEVEYISNSNKAAVYVVTDIIPSGTGSIQFRVKIHGNNQSSGTYYPVMRGVILEAFWMGLGSSGNYQATYGNRYYDENTGQYVYDTSSYSNYMKYPRFAFGTWLDIKYDRASTPHIWSKINDVWEDILRGRSYPSNTIDFFKSNKSGGTNNVVNYLTFARIYGTVGNKPIILIPCTRPTEADPTAQEAGFYNAVSGAFYPNTGSGTLLYGGTVEPLTSIETATTN